MESVPEECRALLLKADVYVEQGDDYNAIKLYKRAIRMAPSWISPYAALGQLYKRRKEWKAVVYYHKKVVSLDPKRKENWWDLGIGASATGRFRLARTVWNKFGISSTPRQKPVQIAVQLTHNGMFEVVGALKIDPARAMLISIPHPKSDRSYRDIILIDKNRIGTTITGNKKWPIFQELDLLKRSHFQTWSCVLENATEHDLQILEKLADEAKVGIEIWSNASKSMDISNRSEYFSTPHAMNEEGEVIIAFGARRARHVREVLRSWQVISLKRWHDLERHR